VLAAFGVGVIVAVMVFVAVAVAVAAFVAVHEAESQNNTVFKVCVGFCCFQFKSQTSFETLRYFVCLVVARDSFVFCNPVFGVFGFCFCLKPQNATQNQRNQRNQRQDCRKPKKP
jgi:hypothetical protein